MDKELEEAIKRLRHEDDFVYMMSNKSVFKDVETVLNALEQKDNEIQELKQDMHELYISNKYKKKNWTPKSVLNSYISKDKIKNKIEELNNNIQYLSKFKDWKEKDYTNEDIINNCIEVLKELLE